MQKTKASTNGTLPISLYKIEDGRSLAGIVESMTDDGYTPQRTQYASLGGYNLSLYYMRTGSTPKWKKFVGTIAHPEEAIHQANRSANERFVLFLASEATGNIYAITGGAGYFAIQDFISNSFGIDIISRLIKKDDKILRSTRETSLVGGILGQTKYFRNDFNLFENDGFGKIYQELKAKLEKGVLTSRLGLEETTAKKGTSCVAKSSFKIDKALTFDQMIKIIDSCEAILMEEGAISINNAEKLNSKKDRELISSLNIQLMKQLWDRYSTPETGYEFDLCHSKFEEYLTSGCFVVCFGTKKSRMKIEFERLDNIDDLFCRIKNSDKAPKDLVAFTEIMQSLKIQAFDDAGEMTTSGDIFKHLLGDVSIDNKKYFYVDNAWYFIKDEFVAELNSACEQFIKSNKISLLAKSWGYKSGVTENEYNGSFIGEDNTLVLDKITGDNIELCDVLKWDDETVYLCHVKAGMANSVRDLCAQISVAATKLSADMNTSGGFLRVVYRSLLSKTSNDPYFQMAGKQAESIDEESFIKLFDGTRRIKFVLAILDTATQERVLQDITKFHSNIAKFSIRELSKSMKMHDGMDLLIEQIFQTSQQ